MRTQGVHSNALIAFLWGLVLGLIGTGRSPVPVPIEGPDRFERVKTDRLQEPEAVCFLGDTEVRPLLLSYDGWVPVGRAVARLNARSTPSDRAAYKRRYDRYLKAAYEALEKRRAELHATTVRWRRTLRLLPKVAKAAALSLLIPALIAHAATIYYASPSGNDSTGTGSFAAPVKTISKAVDLATSSGDVIKLRVGDYASLDSNAGGQRPRDGLTIENYDGEAVTISKAHGGTAATNATSVIDLKGWTNCTIRSNALGGLLTVRQTGSPAAQADGYLYVDNSTTAGIRWHTASGAASNTGNTVTGVTVSHIFGIGLLFESGADHVATSNFVTDCANGMKINAGVDNVTIDANEVADIGYMIKDGPVKANTGANGVALDGATNWIATTNLLHGCWSRTGSAQYGMDGGAFEYFNVPDGQAGSISGNWGWDNHGSMETGNNIPNANGGGVNATFDHNLFFGRGDFQAQGSNPGGGPTTPYILIRAMRDTPIHHNTWDHSDGGPSGGIRFDHSGQYATNGNITGNTIRDNILHLRYSATAYQFGSLAIPAGTAIDHNIVYYNFDRGTNNVLTSAAGNFNLTQLAAAQAATGLLASELWGDLNTNTAAANPLFVDPDNATLLSRNYHIQSASPARGTASDASDRGALPFVLVGPTVSVNATQAFGVGNAYDALPRTGKASLTIRM